MDGFKFNDSTRFDAAEALNVLAHDYGLYAVKTRLDNIPFNAGAGRDTLEGLDDQGREFYAEWEPLAANTDPYEVPEWADALFSAIDAARGVEE